MSTLQATNLKNPSSASNNIVLDSSGNAAVQAGTAAAPSLYVSGDSNTGIYSPGADSLAITTGGSQRATVDSSGRVLVGTSTADTEYNGSSAGWYGIVSINRNAYDATAQFRNWSSDANLNSSGGTSLFLSRSKSGTVGTHTALASGDDIGGIIFNASDGSNFRTAASIKATCDGGVSTADVPGRLVFSTTADGASSPTERMRISSTGLVDIPGGTSGSYSGQQPSLFGVHNGSSSGQCLVHISGHSGNGSGSNTYALRISQNVDNNIEASAALRIDHSNPAGGTGGALIQAFSNLSNSTAQRIWQVNSVGSQVINRPPNDGTLIDFQQAQTSEGSISVSGTTVSYNGAHLSRWSQLPGNAQRTEILRGTVLSNIDEMCQWEDQARPEVLWKEGEDLPDGVSVGDVKEPAHPGGLQENEQLNCMKVSDLEGDPNVAGVFQAWDDDDDTYTDDFYCAMTGDFIIRIAEGVTVQRGDLLMSAGDGTAKPQDDDIIRSKTVAKVTSTHVTCTYDDGSYCVPCVLMAC